MEGFAPRVPVKAFGDGDDRDTLIACRSECLQRRSQLRLATVKDYEIGPGGFGVLGGAWSFFLQAGEAAAQHLAHHAGVVAGHGLFGLDVEFAVLILGESVGSGDDHDADRVRALDVTVVVNLDAPRWTRQAEGFGKCLQKAGLRGGFREAAAERGARIQECVLDQFAFFAALGDHDLDLLIGADRERFGQEIAILDFM